MSLLAWIREKLTRRKMAKETPNLSKFVQVLDYEEEALKRLKRINELREEMDKLIERRVKKGVPKDEAAFTAVKETAGRRLTLRDLEGIRKT